MCCMEITDPTKIPVKSSNTMPFTKGCKRKGAYLRRMNRTMTPTFAPAGGLSNKAIRVGNLIQGKQSTRFVYMGPRT